MSAPSSAPHPPLPTPPRAPARLGSRTAGRIVVALLVAALLAAVPLPGAAQDPAPPGIDMLLMHMSSSVMLVSVPRGSRVGYGTAVQIEDDLAVTNCHVLGTSREAEVVVAGTPRIVPLVAADLYHDLCLLEVPARSRRVAPRVASSSLRAGETTYALGFFGGHRFLSTGPIEARFAMDRGYVLRTGAGFQSGGSGGGLFDNQGRLAGILTFYRRNGAAPAFMAVPVEWIDALVQRWRSGGVEDDRPPFWDVSRGEADAPRFLHAMSLEARSDWPALEAFARQWLAEDPYDDGARMMLDLARHAPMANAAQSGPVGPPMLPAR